jgi:hypothetical protein
MEPLVEVWMGERFVGRFVDRREAREWIDREIRVYGASPIDYRIYGG